MAVKKLKKCPHCASLETKENGKFIDIQRYKYSICTIVVLHFLFFAASTKKKRNGRSLLLEMM